MIETDAPYLTLRTIKPNRVRPWRNEPCLLPWVISKVAQARGETMEDVAAHTMQTTKKFFQI
jgi:TatD DNase family protein